MLLLKIQRPFKFSPTNFQNFFVKKSFLDIFLISLYFQRENQKNIRKKNNFFNVRLAIKKKYWVYSSFKIKFNSDRKYSNQKKNCLYFLIKIFPYIFFVYIQNYEYKITNLVSNKIVGSQIFFTYSFKFNNQLFRGFKQIKIVSKFSKQTKLKLKSNHGSPKNTLQFLKSNNSILLSKFMQGFFACAQKQILQNFLLQNIKFNSNYNSKQNQTKTGKNYEIYPQIYI
eukprot:TRINITY_DN10785_c0_g1_i6.p3 TRINITY_DN10785_c0_g1~~TRINITY_DN10785_c0_g1_i6.p3  ORF type:complete len:227 (-),score=-10.15 TRINITY_DN10785_c0_g1_i6:430-1110(-)